MLPVGLSLLLLAPLSVRADDQLARQLLTEGWGNTKAAKAFAAPLIRQAEDANPSAEIAYAVGLTLISQKDYHGAIEWMNLATLDDSPNLDARRAEIWLLARTRQHNRALAELSQFLDNLATEKKLEREHREQLIRFAGRMMGFYSGPASNAVTPATLNRTSREVLEKLTKDDIAPFEDAQDSMLEQFRAAVEEKGIADDAAEADAEIIQENLIADLERRQASLIADLNRLQPQLNQLREDARKELESIRGKDDPLAREITTLESRIVSLDSELLLIFDDIRRLEFRASRERDPYFRDLYLRDADRLRLTASRIEADLISAQRQHGIVINRRRQLQNEFKRTEAHFNAQIEGIQEAILQNHRAQRRAAVELERALKGPNVDQRRSRAIQAQFNAITTYEEFPLEEARSQLLESLGDEE